LFAGVQGFILSQNDLTGLLFHQKVI